MQHSWFIAASTLLFMDFCRAKPSIHPSSWTLAATGDIIGDVVATDDPRTLAIWNITKAADFSFFNMEGQILDEKHFDGYPASENGADNAYGGIGGGPTYPLYQAIFLAKQGFNLASHANNHAWDYDLVGMKTTHRNLAKAGIKFSGSGLSLQEARRAVYIERNGNKLALVSAAGTHTPQSVAGPGDSEENLNPRPGVSALRANLVTVVNKKSFDVIRDIALAQGQALTGQETDITLYTGQTPMDWSNWRLGGEGDASLDWDINADDYNGILDSIREAKRHVKTAIFSLHAHESASGADDSVIPLPYAATVPASYTQNISHGAIDAGADVVLVHGPHHLRGIEIYKSRPIFYGLGSLTYSLGLHFRGYDLPIEWDDGIIAETLFKNDRPVEIVLHPTVHNQLTNDTSLPDRTMPKIAPKAEAARILEHLQNTSTQFKTKIVVKDGKGYLKVA
ncbi:hypothetical protein NW762_013229 [Fusarium torreyae]|uniref:Capsule synthesis protein CapA domain-containing protein n=1 Tax=Fusarium torreyae TaxID=1237075 RepID=A0A9W8RMF0_9HYPO|nr:hypothetical protein NW762_013229 [Fusarium torreyae]